MLTIDLTDYNKLRGENSKTQGKCPKCNISFDGEPIPKKYRHCYSAPYIFATNIIGIEVPELYDGVSFWQCTSCGFAWDRFTGRAAPLMNSTVPRKS